MQMSRKTSDELYPPLTSDPPLPTSLSPNPVVEPEEQENRISEKWSRHKKKLHKRKKKMEEKNLYDI